MKVIKRDGRAVEYDKRKIQIAIEKSNKEVKADEKAKKKDINKIIKSIEELDKKRILVEDIQDLIEQKLMEIGKYNLAKKYIVYRYTRALARKQNFTDQSIFGTVKNNDELSNLGLNSAIKQREYIASTVSTNLTRRILLPEKIIKAWDKKQIYFNDSDYFITPIFNSSFIDVENILNNYTNDNIIDVCILINTIIENVALFQYGEIAINPSFIANYINNKTSKKELEIAINILLSINHKTNFEGENIQINYIIDIKEDDILKDFYEILLRKIEENKYLYPRIYYILNEFNLPNNKNDYFTKIAACIPKTIFCSKKILNDNCYIMGDFNILKSSKRSGKFNQGIVSINLLSIANEVIDNQSDLFKTLDEHLEICEETLMYRYYSLKNTPVNISPIDYIYGGIKNIESDKIIDNLLKDSYSNLILEYYGLEQMTKKIINKEYYSKEGKEFSTNIVKYIKDTLNKWHDRYNILFSLKKGAKEEINSFFDIEKHDNEIEMMELLTFEKNIQKYHTGGYITKLNKINESNIDEILNFAYNNLQAVEFFDNINEERIDLDYERIN